MNLQSNMQMLISEVLSSVIQVVIFSLIPCIWWFVTARKKQNFFQWIGMKKFGGEKSLQNAGWIVLTIIGFELVGAVELYSLNDVSTATSIYSGMGLSALPAIIVYAVFHTSLSEEILFRGFLLKRIGNKFGFAIGNAIQALLFGLLHGALFITEAGVVRALLLVIFTGAIAWVMGYINEKKANGSICPSWIIHGVTNIISGVCSAFTMI